MMVALLRFLSRMKSVFDRRTGLLIGYLGLFTGFLYGNIFLIIGGAVVCFNEMQGQEEDNE